GRLLRHCCSDVEHTATGPETTEKSWRWPIRGRARGNAVPVCRMHQELQTTPLGELSIDTRKRLLAMPGLGSLRTCVGVLPGGLITDNKRRRGILRPNWADSRVSN